MKSNRSTIIETLLIACICIFLGIVFSTGNPAPVIQKRGPFMSINPKIIVDTITLPADTIYHLIYIIDNESVNYILQADTFLDGPYDPDRHVLSFESHWKNDD